MVSTSHYKLCSSTEPLYIIYFDTVYQTRDSIP